MALCIYHIRCRKSAKVAFQGAYNGIRDCSRKSLALPLFTLDHHEYIQTDVSKPVWQLVPALGTHRPRAVYPHLPPHPVGAPLVGALVADPPMWVLCVTLCLSWIDHTMDLQISGQTSVKGSWSMSGMISIWKFVSMCCQCSFQESELAVNTAVH